jgi:hypothetical protein
MELIERATLDPCIRHCKDARQLHSRALLLCKPGTRIKAADAEVSNATSWVQNVARHHPCVIVEKALRSGKIMMHACSLLTAYNNLQ